jgi:hypothetical protein
MLIDVKLRSLQSLITFFSVTTKLYLACIGQLSESIYSRIVTSPTPLIEHPIVILTLL